MAEASSLSPPTLRRLEVAAALKRHREALELTTAEVLDATGFSASKLSRIETGNRRVQIPDLVRLCELYGLDNDEQERLTKLVGEARRTTRKPVVDNPDYTDLELAASAIDDYKTTIITGLLQTPDYTVALFRRFQPNIPNDLMEKVINDRRRRQEDIFRRPHPPRLNFVMDEAAIRRVVGGRSTMRGQLEHLARLSSEGPLTLQVIPFSVGAHPGMDGLFTIMSFDEAIRDRVYVDGLLPSTFLVAMEDLQRYRSLFGQLQELSLNPEESERLIGSVARAL
ncbi:helix-turn-helix domain-containing protein [Cryptosporangium aurantiacum]|uniref:Helix-turn-helix domain-containing protein n=1 Tax=Cryptosporangium aurantiacum TaxID=134849 RepID=A0A1M7JNU0_9ACTN|nr:helix-turn-helix transcriptional regulator [Cryptosporangium aurantiacum]SHM54561.1 Helix-turn-helix domain-containing protein [Cryptosporangium aurantiacum]